MRASNLMYEKTFDKDVIWSLSLLASVECKEISVGFDSCSIFINLQNGSDWYSSFNLNEIALWRSGELTVDAATHFVLGHKIFKRQMIPFLYCKLDCNIETSFHMTSNVNRPRKRKNIF